MRLTKLLLPVLTFAMPFTLAAFGALRPYLYHLTDAANLPRLRRVRLLQSAAALAREAGRDHIIEARRRVHTPLVVGGETVWLRDQAPLHKGNMALEPDWSFERFVGHLNARVFFWPGGATGPISYGQRHFGRYAAEQPAIIRVRVAALLAANPDVTLEFSRCNSGSPRYNRGKAGARGGHTFSACAAASFRAAEVVEVTALTSVMLPDTTEYGSSPSGAWERL